ncbi:MAG: mismatch-specific DNA-glycosylase [Acidimicrobiales bacterium]
MSDSSSSHEISPDKRAPGELGSLHRGLSPGAALEISLHWSEPPELTEAVVVGAGFSITSSSENHSRFALHRERTLADTVSADMAVLICGLNPSPASADSGVAFHRPGNRFWPAALAADLVSKDRDPLHALAHHGLGMTDIVKRTTSKASEIAPGEFSEGIKRVETLVRWLKPNVVCFVGLAGWRLALDRKATAGWQNTRLGDRPTYLMPSTSGLNASSSLADLTSHLRKLGLASARSHR